MLLNRKNVVWSLMSKHKLTDEFSINGSYTYVKVEEDNKDGNGFKTRY